MTRCIQQWLNPAVEAPELTCLGFPGIALEPSASAR